MLEALAQVCSIPLMLIIIYAILAIYRKIIGDTPSVWHKLIPLWAALLGMVMGMFVYTVFPEIIPVTSLFTAVILGLITGLATTGLNQLLRVFDKDTTNSKKENSVGEDETDEKK